MTINLDLENCNSYCVLIQHLKCLGYYAANDMMLDNPDYPDYFLSIIFSRMTVYNTNMLQDKKVKELLLEYLI